MKRGRGGVQYEDLLLGAGARAEWGTFVTVAYDLFLNRGEKVQEIQMSTFQLGLRRIIAGFEYGVEGMREGGKRRIRVGPHLAYRGAGLPELVPANAVLVFHVTLASVAGTKNGRKGV